MLDTVVEALGKPRKWLWQALPGLHDRETGEALSGAQLAQNAFGLDPESTWGKALGFGLEVAGDPLGVATMGAGHLLGAGAKAAGIGGSKLAPLLKARRGFSMARGVDDAGQAARVVGPNRPLPWHGDLWQQMMGQGYGGAYVPGARMGFVNPRVPAAIAPEIGRHEVLHGIRHSAVLNPELARGLPVLTRASAAMGRSQSPFVQAMGELTNELASHAMQAKTPLARAGDAAKFLLGQSPAYRGQIGRLSPLAAEMYEQLPALVYGGLAGGAGVGAYGLLKNRE